MYKLIGSDQQEYGPVTADQIKQWIAEGRANGATLLQAEGATEWVPISGFPEFADALAAKNPPSPPGLPPAAPLPADPAALADHIRNQDYDLDIGLCVSRSWELLKRNFGILVGATVLFFILTIGISQLLGLLTGRAMQSLVQGNISAGPILVLVLVNVPQMILSMVLTAGLYNLMLKLIRGQATGIGDLFSGFTTCFVQLAAAGIVVQLLSMLGFLLCVLPGIYLSVAWILTIPLIIDRGLDFWAAMELSRKVVTHHWWLMFCLIIVVALINIAGILACCIGIFAAFPLGLGAVLYAYEDIFRGPGSAQT